MDSLYNYLHYIPPMTTTTDVKEYEKTNRTYIEYLVRRDSLKQDQDQPVNELLESEKQQSQQISNDVMTFYHGGVEPDFTIEKLDVLRNAEKQQKTGSNYAGFYMYGKQDYEAAVKYAKQENDIKGTNTKGVVKITMPSNVRIYEVPPFTITRITKENIIDLQQKGYDLIAGKMLGKIEYVLINKNKVLSMEFQQLNDVLQNQSANQIEQKVTDDLWKEFDQSQPKKETSKVDEYFWDEFNNSDYLKALQSDLQRQKKLRKLDIQKRQHQVFQGYTPEEIDEMYDTQDNSQDIRGRYR